MDNYDKGLDLCMKLTRLAHEWDTVKRLDYDDPIYVKWREENDRACDEADALIREWTGERTEMNKMTLRMKSGEEFNFQCEEFEIVRSNVMGRALTGAKIDEAIYFITGDVESITWHKPLPDTGEEAEE